MHSAQAPELAGAIERLSTLLRHLSPAGLSLTAAATLATLSRSGPIRLTQLAAIEGVSQPAMTQLVTRLERTGLVARSSDPGDRRAVLVALTSDGEAELASRRATRTERLAEMLAHLSPADQQALADARPAFDALIRLVDPRTEGDPS
ncbi:DNA-binding MarR family transcriptional regulator [Mumia flava]|uniref:DNA-binding MarR family transcriptional regulator n=1 Tax=Mumia flava TaxID=1348852 RepID=A0A0B2B339_9ACTN|nr:MarR family transcriptional regulator [Mumia flava]PJJ57879.1 DNA-binding MarR family transcriptional regulator [Mumia flava]